MTGSSRIQRRIVCFGSSRVGPEHPATRTAHEVGRILAERGIAVVSGGYDGTMGAVSEGAASAGGVVIGVTTPIFSERRANPHVAVEWTEPDYLSRLSTLCRQAHGFVALPGGLGTLSEWVTAWCLLSIGQAVGPLYLFEDPWRRVFDTLITLEEIRPPHAELLHWLREPADLGRALDAAAR